MRWGPILRKKDNIESWEKDMHSITQHISSLLDDTSFPPLVMLDGRWGEGKTYFAKNTLIPELQNQGHSCVFFSLTGLSSINDFKDRLLSLSLLNSELNSESSKSASKTLTSIISKFGGKNGGGIASILNGASGLVKEIMLSKLDDKTIIIDDLDRVDNKKLSNLIIGECLQLTNDSNLKFLFIVNDKKNLADAELKEKVFSGIVKLNKNFNENIEIAFSNYAWFKDFRHEIETIVSQKKLKNLRVMKRASKKIDEIYKVIQSNESLDFDGCMTTLIKVTFLTMYYHYEMKFSEADIWENSEESIKMPGDKEEKRKCYELVNIHHFLTKPLISFLVGGSNYKVSIEDFGRLQKKNCLIDDFLFCTHFNRDDESFERHVDALKNFVFDKTNVPFTKWFEAALLYHNLQYNDFFCEKRPDISETFDELFDKKDFDYSGVDECEIRIRIAPEDKLIFDKYEEEKKSHLIRVDQDKALNYLEQMKHGWDETENEICRRH
jgi:hypothetical protein